MVKDVSALKYFNDFKTKYFGKDLPMKVIFCNRALSVATVLLLFIPFIMLYLGFSQIIVYDIVYCVALNTAAFFLMNKTQKYSLFMTITCYNINLIVLPIVYLFADGINNGLYLYFIIGLVVTALFIDGYLMILSLLFQSAWYGLVFYYSYIKADYFSSFVHIKDISPYLAVTANVIAISLTLGPLIRMLSIQYENERKVVLNLVNKLEDLSIKDPLTGAFNRRFLFSYLEEAINRYKKDGQPITLIIFDIDKFKNLNDTYGHLIGDEVIINVVKILQQNCRSYDIVSRYGGEEFVVVLPGASEETAYFRANQMRSKVEESVLCSISNIKVTISGGIALYTNNISAEEFIETADKNLYIAKNTGRNKIVWKDGFDQEPVVDLGFKFFDDLNTPKRRRTDKNY